MFKYFVVFILSTSIMFSSSLCAEENLKVYFVNDSINGFQISDAYETHNMGVVYESNEHKIHLDFGIVTPDMHEYINEYRKANRSYGEIITIKYHPKYLSYENKSNTYVQAIAAGDFGLDKAQDFVHRALNLQPVAKINTKIQMPNNVWVGVGTSFSQTINANTSLNTHGYLGSNSAFLDLSVNQSVHFLQKSIKLNTGLRGVLFDKIISANPINALPRKIIPFVIVGTSFNVLGFELSLSNTISLPSIKEDNSIYSRTQVSYEINF